MATSSDTTDTMNWGDNFALIHRAQQLAVVSVAGARKCPHMQTHCICGCGAIRTIPPNDGPCFVNTEQCCQLDPNTRSIHIATRIMDMFFTQIVIEVCVCNVCKETNSILLCNASRVQQCSDYMWNVQFPGIFTCIAIL